MKPESMTVPVDVDVTVQSITPRITPGHRLLKYVCDGVDCDSDPTSEVTINWLVSLGNGNEFAVIMTNNLWLCEWHTQLAEYDKEIHAQRPVRLEITNVRTFDFYDERIAYEAEYHPDK